MSYVVDRCKCGKVLTYEDAEEAKKYIGKACVVCNDLRTITEKPKSLEIRILKSVDLAPLFGFGNFLVASGPYVYEDYQFMRLVEFINYHKPYPDAQTAYAHLKDKPIHLKTSSNDCWVRPAGYDPTLNKIYIPLTGWISLNDLCEKWVDEDGRPCGVKSEA